jgi:hypothetical protein
MAKYSNDENMNAYLDNIKDNADELVLCSAIPITYYEGCDPPAWIESTVHTIGDVVRPATRAGKVYECTTGGTSKSGAEPAWDTTPGQTTVDNTVTWTCRINYAQVSVAITSANFTGPVNGDADGRKLTVNAQNDQDIFVTDDAIYCALLDGTNKVVLFVTSTTTQTLTSGNKANLPAWDIEVSDPS